MIITVEMVITSIATVIPVLTFFIAIWAKLETRIDSAKARAQLVADEFARYQTHVAETYITKQGLREQTDQLMSAMTDVKSTVEHLTMRIDQVFIDQRPMQRKMAP